MRVFKLFEDMHPDYIGSRMPYRLDDKDSLFRTLGFEPISVGVQWQLIVRLALMGVITGTVMFRDEQLDLEDIYPEVQNFSELPPEIHLRTGAEFIDAFSQLERKYAIHTAPKHVCRLVKSGSTLSLVVDDLPAVEIRRFHQDTLLDKLFNYLLFNKPNLDVSRGELLNTDDFFIDKVNNLNSIITNNKLDAIRPFIVAVSKNKIHITPSVEMNRHEVSVLIQKISEKYRKPILAYLESQ